MQYPLSPSKQNRSIGLNGQAIHAARRPFGANALQPIANSGLPGTSEMMPIKKAPNSRGIPSANWSNDLAIYGPQGSQRRQDANEAYQSFSGSAIQRGPYTPDAEGQTEPMQLSAYTGNPYGSTEPKAKAPMTPSSAPMGMTSSGQAFDYSTGKFASQQPPQQSQKPELDRWTDLGVDASDYHNLKAGNVSPQQWNGIKQGAIQNNLDRFNHISPQRQGQFDKDVAADRKAAMDAAGNEQRYLSGHYTNSLNKQADIYGQRADSIEAMNKRLDEGGGLQYRQSSTGFGTPEQVSQDAASLNALYGADKARQDEVNAQQRAGFDAYQTSKLERDNAQREQGIDPEAAKRDVNRLSGAFQSITKQRVAPGYRFVDYVEDEINSGRLSPDSDAIGIIEQNYGHSFNKTQPQQSGQVAPAPSALDLARAKHADRQDMLQEQRDYGMAQRQQLAAQQGADRTREAKLIATRGMSPAQASAAVGRDNMIEDAYNQQRLQGQDRLAADVQKHQLNVYGQDLADQRRFKDLDAKRAYDLAIAQAKAQAAAAQPPKQNGKASGNSGVDPTGKPSQAGQQSQAQPQSPRVKDSIASLTADKKFKKNDPGSLGQAARAFNDQGLTREEQAQALGQLFDADFSDRDVATGTMSNIATHARNKAKQDGSWTDQHGVVQRRIDQNILDHAHALRSIGFASGMSPQEIAEQLYPKHLSMGTHDPFLQDRRQALIDAIGIDNQEEDE